ITTMDSRFNEILNALSAYGKVITNEDQILKILRSLPPEWDAKAYAIEEGKDCEALTKDELIGILLAHEMHLAARKRDRYPSSHTALRAK
ncbi:UNVERIFIED_CONTAM: hypothetical protein ITH36_25300, partial [Salmonella enterica subsp. enterica serovar Weltevreden]